MGSNSTKAFVNEENERHTEVDKIVQIVQLENGLNKTKTSPPEVQSFAEVHLENNLDSISEIISSIPLENNQKKNKVAEKDKIGAIFSEKPRINDTEVDDAIAELEETFRSLDKEKSFHSSAPASSSSNHSSERLSSRAGTLNVPPSSVPQQRDQPQELIPFGGSPPTAGSCTSWETLHSPEIHPSRDFTGSSKPNTGPPTRAVDQFLPRRPHLPSRASIVSQRSRSQNGRTTAGVYSPASHNPLRPHHQSSLSRLHQQHSPRGSSSQIIVIQQQNQRLAELLLFDPPPNSPKKSSEWIYQPPKIEGFDIDKFKELNRKDASPPISYSLHVPRPRDDYMNGSMERSRESLDYTKDELELIASLEREIF